MHALGASIGMGDARGSLPLACRSAVPPRKFCEDTPQVRLYCCVGRALVELPLATLAAVRCRADGSQMWIGVVGPLEVR